MASTPIQNLKRTLNASQRKRARGKGATVNAANTQITFSAANANKYFGKKRAKLLDVGRGQRA
jgi:hypothetical protein